MKKNLGYISIAVLAISLLILSNYIVSYRLVVGRSRRVNLLIKDTSSWNHDMVFSEIKKTIEKKIASGEYDNLPSEKLEKKFYLTNKNTRKCIVVTAILGKDSVKEMKVEFGEDK